MESEALRRIGSAPISKTKHKRLQSCCSSVSYRAPPVSPGMLVKRQDLVGAQPWIPRERGGDPGSNPQGVGMCWGILMAPLHNYHKTSLVLGILGGM